MGSVKVSYPLYEVYDFLSVHLFFRPVNTPQFATKERRLGQIPTACGRFTGYDLVLPVTSFNYIISQATLARSRFRSTG